MCSLTRVLITAPTPKAPLNAHVIEITKRLMATAWQKVRSQVLSLNSCFSIIPEWNETQRIFCYFLTCFIKWFKWKIWFWLYSKLVFPFAFQQSERGFWIKLDPYSEQQNTKILGQTLLLEGVCPVTYAGNKASQKRSNGHTVEVVWWCGITFQFEELNT